MQKHIWQPYDGKRPSVERQEDNEHGGHAGKQVKDDVGGHILRELSRCIWHFLKQGAITCEGGLEVNTMKHQKNVVSHF